MNFTKKFESLSPDELKNRIELIYDFPCEGNTYKDLKYLYSDAQCFFSVIENLAIAINSTFDEFDYIASIEAQGFILGGALAYRLGVGFIHIRKAGKLAGETIKTSFEMLYDTTTLEVQTDIVKDGAKIILIDDVIATGESANAAQSLVESLGGKAVGFAFLVELDGYGARTILDNKKMVSLIYFPPDLT